MSIIIMIILPSASVISAIVTVAPFLVVASLGVNLAAKHIQAVADVQHRIGVDTVILRVGTTGGIYPPLVVALLSEQIIEVKGNDE